MHPEAWAFVASALERVGQPESVLEVGGRNINGSIRRLFATADYTALDIAEGAGVDIVADASAWRPSRKWGCVVSCEVFEHTAEWPAIVATMAAACTPGGYLIVTAAGPGREPHSAVDGGRLRAGEWYANVDPADLAATLAANGFEADVVSEGPDVYALAEKGWPDA